MGVSFVKFSLLQPWLETAYSTFQTSGLVVKSGMLLTELMIIFDKSWYSCPVESRSNTKSNNHVLYIPLIILWLIHSIAQDIIFSFLLLTWEQNHLAPLFAAPFLKTLRLSIERVFQWCWWFVCFLLRFVICFDLYWL